MKAVRPIVFTALVLVLLASIAGPATASPGVTIRLLNRLPPTLALDESYTIDILVRSEEPFRLAMAMVDAYYPGRGVYSAGPDHASWTTEAVLHQTLTGKRSTADLPAVTDWPATEDWPAGVAPLALVVGVRQADGTVVSEQFVWAVTVP